MFVFRYFQTLDSKIVPFLSDMRVYALCYGIYFLGGVMTIAWPANQQLLTREQLLGGLRNVDPYIYSLMVKEVLVVGFNVS
jgi:hypothetical protein